MSGPLVVVAGAMANKPGNGGEAWVRASWVRGLSRLGCRVAFVEEIAPDAWEDSTGGPGEPRLSANRAWFDEIADFFGWAGSSALVCAGQVISGGLDGLLEDVVRECDLLVNISGNLQTARLFDACQRRIYVDLDPGFTQLWATDRGWAARLEAHHAFVTTGANIGTARCLLPTAGLEWHHLPPPVVLDDWPVPEEVTFGGFTTVASWRGPFGPVQWDGRLLGSKVHEFRRFATLPALVASSFELALAIHPADSSDLDMLRRNGWAVRDPARLTATPDSFRSYLQGSGAEFSVAQAVYVAPSTGWFSDRSTRYLASGRPVLVQDTGFTDFLPAGKGVLAFGSMEEAVSGAEAILADYQSHCTAARRIAEDYFDSDRVLYRFLESFLP